MAKKRTKAAKRPARKAAKKSLKRTARRTAKPRPPAKRAAKAARSAPARPVPPPRAAAPAPAVREPKSPVAKLPPEKQIVGGVYLGPVDDYFSHVGVIALKLQAPVSVGDMIRIKGHTTDITQKIESMQIEHQSVQTASTGDSIGIKVADRARKGDAVYKI